LGQPRSTQRYECIVPESGKRLTERIVELAREYGRYGYRRITAMLKTENPNRV